VQTDNLLWLGVYALRLPLTAAGHAPSPVRWAANTNNSRQPWLMNSSRPSWRAHWPQHNSTALHRAHLLALAAAYSFKLLQLPAIMVASCRHGTTRQLPSRVPVKISTTCEHFLSYRTAEHVRV